MKKLIVILPFLIVSIVNAQEKYEKYLNSYFEKEYDILYSKNASDKYSLYVMMASMDKYREEGGLIFKEKDCSKFISKLAEAKAKYQEWVNTAKDNNVVELDKEMSFSYSAEGFFKAATGWKFDNYVNLTFDFKISNKKNLLIIRTGKMTASDNQYIDHDGFVFVFSNEKEIDDLANKLSEEQVLKYSNQPKKTDLFN